jgi:hypothetical protein
VTISNDGATILSLLSVENPAGRIFVDLSQKQDKEVGDGTTSVVIIAAELLRRANELVKANDHHRLPARVPRGVQVHAGPACHQGGRARPRSPDQRGEDEHVEQDHRRVCVCYGGSATS